MKPSSDEYSCRDERSRRIVARGKGDLSSGVDMTVLCAGTMTCLIRESDGHRIAFNQTIVLDGSATLRVIQDPPVIR